MGRRISTSCGSQGRLVRLSGGGSQARRGRDRNSIASHSRDRQRGQAQRRQAARAGAAATGSEGRVLKFAFGGIRGTGAGKPSQVPRYRTWRGSDAEAALAPCMRRGGEAKPGTASAPLGPRAYLERRRRPVRVHFRVVVKQVDASSMSPEMRHVTHVGGRHAAEAACAAVVDYYNADPPPPLPHTHTHT